MLRLQHVTDGIFVDELQDSVFHGGIEMDAVAAQFDVTEDRIQEWLLGKNLPPRVTQHAVLQWLCEQLDLS